MTARSTRIGSTDPARDLARRHGDPRPRSTQVEKDYPYLDKPLFVQYGYWIKDIVTGDMGPLRTSPASRSIDMFKQRAPTTVFIGF